MKKPIKIPFTNNEVEGTTIYGEDLFSNLRNALQIITTFKRGFIYLSPTKTKGSVEIKRHTFLCEHYDVLMPNDYSWSIRICTKYVEFFELGELFYAKTMKK